MQKSGKVVAKAAAAPAAKKATAAKAPAKKTTAKKHTWHESAKTRRLAAAKAARTRAANKKKAAAAARSLEPGMSFDGCVITAVAARLHLAGLAPRYGDLIAAFRAAGGRPRGGVPIPAMLLQLGERGIIAGFAPVDIEPEALDEPGLILGVSLPGPHAVVTVPALLPALIPFSRSVTAWSRRPAVTLGSARWLSWGTTWDPATGFPDAITEEAWRIW